MALHETIVSDTIDTEQKSNPHYKGLNTLLL